MRVLFLSNFYPPYDIGGYEQWCREVAVRLVERGHTIAVLTSNYGLKPGSENGTENVSRTLFLQTDNNYYDPAAFFLKRPSQEQANIRTLRHKINTFRPDIIMVWGMWNLTLNLPFYAEQWLPGRVAYFISNYWPMDTDLHTAYWQMPTRRSLLWGVKRPLSGLALRKLRREGYPPKLQLDHAVCCSQFVRSTLVEAGKLPTRAEVLYGGIDPEPFLENSILSDGYHEQEKGPLRLLYFGRLIHDKGVHTAIEAVGLLKQRGLTAADLTLTILGSGHPDYETKLRELVERYEIVDQVRFVDQVPRESIPAWLGQFQVNLFTSIWPEPMARSMMEAMAAGLLVIGTEVGGQVEMLTPGKNALTYQAEDAETLANHIICVAGDPSLRIRLARAGQKLVLEKFTLNRMVDEIELFLHDVVRSGTSITD